MPEVTPKLCSTPDAPPGFFRLRSITNSKVKDVLHHIQTYGMEDPRSTHQLLSLFQPEEFTDDPFHVLSSNPKPQTMWDQVAETASNERNLTGDQKVVIILIKRLALQSLAEDQQEHPMHGSQRRILDQAVRDAAQTELQEYDAYSARILDPDDPASARFFDRAKVVGKIAGKAAKAGGTAYLMLNLMGCFSVGPTPSPDVSLPPATPEVTVTLPATITVAPTETPTPTSTETATPATQAATMETSTLPPEATATPEKAYPLGCFDTEINTQAVNDYLATHPEFVTLDDAMKAHMEKMGKGVVWVGGAVFQGSEAQQVSNVESPLLVKYSVISYLQGEDKINLGCITFAYPRQEKDGNISSGTVTVLSDVEINGIWSGNPFIIGLSPSKSTVFSTRSEFVTWLMTDANKPRTFKVMISEEKDKIWNDQNNIYKDYNLDFLVYRGSLLKRVTLPEDLNLSYMNYFRDKKMWPKEINDPEHPDLEAYQKVIADMIQGGVLPKQAGLMLVGIIQP